MANIYFIGLSVKPVVSGTERPLKLFCWIRDSGPDFELKLCGDYFFKEEEEVKDAWDSSDEEIEVQNDSKVTTPPPTANQRTGSQTETANQKQEKPQTTSPPKVTTPTPNNNVATTNGAKDNKKEKTKSQKQNLETKENHKKSQKHKITNETSVPKTDKGEQKGTSLFLTRVHGTVVVLDCQGS